MAERAEQGVEEEIQPYERSSYVETGQGTRFSERAILLGGHNITLGAKTIIAPEAVFRGDLAKVKLGKHCVVGGQCVIRPAPKKSKGGFNYFPIHVGSHTYIAEGSVVEALKIGSFVSVGRNCVIGKRCIISDCCRIDEGSVIPPDSVLAPFSWWRGAPGVRVGELSDGFEHMMTQVTRSYYDRFLSMAR